MTSANLGMARHPATAILLNRVFMIGLPINAAFNIDCLGRLGGLGLDLMPGDVVRK
jgi:hypothetical protein